MTIERAIELLKELDEGCDPIPLAEEKDALKLGIEALNFYMESSHYATGSLLPGETREE